eukprot:scaffold85419_cov51-Prasinocladus_malaysianus.AAC.1
MSDDQIEQCSEMAAHLEACASDIPVKVGLLEGPLGSTASVFVSSVVDKLTSSVQDRSSSSRAQDGLTVLQCAVTSLDLDAPFNIAHEIVALLLWMEEDPLAETFQSLELQHWLSVPTAEAPPTIQPWLEDLRVVASLPADKATSELERLYASVISTALASKP